MNCEPGDLALIIRSDSGNIDKIVKVLHLHSNNIRDVDGGFVMDKGPRWVLDEPLPSTLWMSKSPCIIYSFPDAYLRPIRNQPGADETLSWCDVPKEVVA